MIVSLQTDLTQVAAFMDAVPKETFAAIRSAVNKTTTQTNKQLQGVMTTRLEIPRNVWRDVRVKVKRRETSGTVWLGLNQVKAAYVGKLRQDAHGAWAGKHYFQGGFIATMKSGHTGLFKRSGARGKRGGQWWSAIEEQTVNVNLGFDVADEVANTAQIELNRQFIEKMLALNPYLKNAQ